MPAEKAIAILSIVALTFLIIRYSVEKG